MKANHHTEPITVILMDGNMKLGEWTQAFAAIPGLGESIEIPGHLHPSIPGYDSRAKVARVAMIGRFAYRIHLEADCGLADSQRPVLVLNSNRIPETQRGPIEAHLRRIFRLPIIEWEAGQEPQPILRFQEPATGRKTVLPALQAKIRSLIPDPVTI